MKSENPFYKAAAKEWTMGGATPEDAQIVQDLRNELDRMQKRIRELEIQRKALEDALTFDTTDENEADLRLRMSKLEMEQDMLKERSSEFQRTLMDNGIDPQKPTLH